MMESTNPHLGVTRSGYLRRRDAALYIRSTYGIPCTQRGLAKLAVIGGGPIYRKAGRFPIYSTADLDEWANSRIGPRRLSTSVFA
jgi:hypothetical protein